MKAVKMSDKTIEKACDYGVTVNKGVMRLIETIEERDREIVKLKGIADKLQSESKQGNLLGNPDELFWSKLESVVRKAMKPESFQPAGNLKVTTTPVKQYGKPIDPEDQYVEPVGRQGREVK